MRHCRARKAVVSDFQPGVVAARLNQVSRFVIRDEEFDRGVRFGREDYEEEFSEETLTDADVMEFIAENLSHENIARSNQMSVFLGQEPLSYSYHVGFVAGWIDALMATQGTREGVYASA